MSEVSSPALSQLWEHVIPSRELALYERSGFGQSSARPTRVAMLVIDVQYRSMGRSPEPIEESIKRYPISCGEHGWQAVPHIARLIDAFRARNLPILFPYVAPKSQHDGQRFAEKAPAVMSIPIADHDFVSECAPQPGDILLPKHHASAFFGTALTSHLISQKIDTILVTGCTTSGCVRATVVDGSSYGFQVIVPHEAVYDRSQASHAVNLFDMQSKYADVMSTDDALTLISSCPQA